MRTRMETTMITGLFRESAPVTVAVFSDEIHKPQILCRAPWTGPHLRLIATRGSASTHSLFLSSSLSLSQEEENKVGF